MTSVVVVGDGISALASTVGLIQLGVPATLVRPHHTVGSDPSVLPWHVLPSLDALDVLDELVAAGRPSRQRQVRVLATGECLTIDLAGAPDLIGHPFDIGCSGALLRSILLTRVVASDLVQIIDAAVTGVTQDEDHVALALATSADDEVRVTAPWVIAADGVGSAMRRLLGVGFPGTTWQERCVDVSLDPDFDFADYAGTTVQVDPRFGAVLRRSVDGWRYLYAEPLAHPGATVGDRVVPTLAAVHPAAASAVQAWTSARMHERAASTFRAGRVLLAGGAAHATNPLSGLGTAASLRDATAVVRALSAVFRSASEEHLLDVYADSRRREFLDRVLPASVELKNLTTQISDPQRLDTELEQYRRAAVSQTALTELLALEDPWAEGSSVF